MVLSLLLFLLLSFQHHSYAQINLKISGATSLTKAQKEIFIKKVQAKIPHNIVLDQQKPIHIFFKKLESRPITANYCQKSPGLKLARLALGNSFKIYLDQQFISIIKAGEPDRDQNIHPTCFYQTTFELLLGTIIHEIAHTFEKNSELSHYFDKSRIDLYQRETFMIQGKRKHLYSKKDLSELSEFKTFAFYNNETLLFDSQSLHYKNSPNTHEFSNRKEKFSVQFEFFAMDQDYACRKPNMFFYFTKILKLRPKYQVNCKLNKKLFTSTLKKEIALTQIYEVQVFISMPHQESTPWGHSSLRLLKCHQRLINDECPPSAQEEIFVDYSMDGVQDLGRGNFINAMLGKFNLNSKIRTKDIYMQQFLTHKGREFFYLPLKLAPKQRKRLINQILENHWGLWSTYTMYANNCTHVLANMIKMATQDFSWDTTQILTPMGFVKKLIQRNLVELRTFNLNKIKQKGLYLDQKETYLTKAWQNLQQSSPISSTFPFFNFKKSFSPQERMNIYRQAIKKDFKKKILLASSALILERYFQTKMEKDLSVLSSSEREQIKELIENYKIKHRVLLSWNLIKENRSYGIPLKAELYDLYDIESKKEQMSLAHQNLLINIKQYHLNSSEYKYTQENIRELSEIIAQRE